LARLLDEEPNLPRGTRIAGNRVEGGKWLRDGGVKREWITVRDNCGVKRRTEADEQTVRRAGLQDDVYRRGLSALH
jgi:hypothetical protein